jgi:hypothetical protein
VQLPPSAGSRSTSTVAAPDADAASAAAIPPARRRPPRRRSPRRASTEQVRGELLAKHLELARLPRVALTHVGVADAAAVESEHERAAGDAGTDGTPKPSSIAAPKKLSRPGQKSPVYAKKNEHSSPPSGRPRERAVQPARRHAREVHRRDAVLDLARCGSRAGAAP